MTGHMRVWIVVEEPAGPGLDLTLVRGKPGPVVAGGRIGGSFLGLDRGAVFETDTGNGSPLPAVVALPSSAGAGCWIEADVCDLLVDEAGRAVLVAALPGHAPPATPLIRVAARMPGGRLAGRGQAAAAVRGGNEQFRRRRAAGRRPSRPAWLPVDIETRQLVSGSIASGAERDLTRLPPRFVRGLGGLLDDEERILASVERPPEASAGLLGWRRARDRRAALLLLTDRQVLWMVDHVPPSRYLLDWGVDAELLPIERMRDLRLRFGLDASRTGLDLRTAAGDISFALPRDLEPEATAFATLLGRFVHPGSGTSVLRRYPITAAPFDVALADRYGQADEATSRIAELAAHGSSDVLAAFYAPRRERVKRAIAVAVTSAEILVDTTGHHLTRIPLSSLRLVTVALSPLLGRIEFIAQDRRASLTYPSPLAEPATTLVRILRKAWANSPPASTPASSKTRPPL
jgi:hypothetical protein